MRATASSIFQFSYQKPWPFSPIWGQSIHVANKKWFTTKKRSSCSLTISCLMNSIVANLESTIFVVYSIEKYVHIHADVCNWKTKFKGRTESNVQSHFELNENRQFQMWRNHVFFLKAGSNCDSREKAIPTFKHLLLCFMHWLLAYLEDVQKFIWLNKKILKKIWMSNGQKINHIPN